MLATTVRHQAVAFSQWETWFLHLLETPKVVLIQQGKDPLLNRFPNWSVEMGYRRDPTGRGQPYLEMERA